MMKTITISCLFATISLGCLGETGKIDPENLQEVEFFKPEGEQYTERPCTTKIVLSEPIARELILPEGSIRTSALQESQCLIEQIEISIDQWRITIDFRQIGKMPISKLESLVKMLMDDHERYLGAYLMYITYHGNLDELGERHIANWHILCKNFILKDLPELNEQALEGHLQVTHLRAE